MLIFLILYDFYPYTLVLGYILQVLNSKFIYLALQSYFGNS